LLERVDKRLLSAASGATGGRHLRDWKLPGFTTGSGCIARIERQILILQTWQFCASERLRGEFLPMEDLRDAWGRREFFCASVSGNMSAQGDTAVCFELSDNREAK
jgi:hypothetical protein